MTSITSDFVALQTALAGRYSLERELGRGGMGIVYLAHEVALDRPVALKLLPPELAADAAVRERFKREARTAAKLSHPNIVPIHAVDEVGGFVFYAMALVDGVTLGERVRTRGPLTDAEATKLIREVAWALAYAHAQGVVHRDVKPDNILIEEATGRALVMDFGIAQVGEAADEARYGADSVVGTAEFMSPEQATGAAVDHRSDLYSLGVVGFYAVSGRVPFDDPSPRAVLARHVTAPAPPVATVAPSVATHLSRTIDRCLRKEPDRRFQDGASIADALALGTAADRVVPVPLRVFIKHLRELSRVSPVGALVLLVLVLPSVLGLLLGGAPEGFVAAVLVLGTIPSAMLGHLLYRIRKVLKAGHTIEDARLALQQDVIQRNEEFRFDVGERETLVDKVAKAVSLAGLSSGAVGLALGGLGIAAAWPVGLTGLVAGASALAFRSARARQRADVAGEGWLKVLGGRVGERLFEVAGLGLKNRALGVGTYRPTEMAISISAVRLFEELPKDTRKTLAGLPDTVAKLESDARIMRRQITELDGVLDEIGDDPAAPGADARATARAEVATTRAAAAKQLEEVVTALETIRLGLLRMHAGERIVQSVTMELESARVLSGDLSHLLEGHREVERLLAERRATGVLPAFER